jgi:CxxC motif-containing protein (DUF1111 family)
MSQSSRFTAVPFRRALPVLAAALAIGACERPAPTGLADDASVVDALFNNADAVGRPVSFLTREQRRLFERGRVVFTRVFTPETGLGPLFNANSCAICHGAPVVGGSGPQIEKHATAFTNNVCEGFDDINGGSVVQLFATPLLQAAGIDSETPLPQTTGVGRRTSPALFGFGLFEAIKDADILSRADPDDRNHDGISGRATVDAEGHVGRFGKKGQVPFLEDFITDATIYEMGITSLDEPDEQLVAGVALPPGVDPAPDPEITQDDLEANVAFVQMLAPPPLIRLNRVQEVGRRIFNDIGCAACHTPAFRTGPSEIQALSGRVVFPYSDFLIHDMGAGLADICAGNATPAEFRTAPLLGLRFLNGNLLHDGRAGSVSEAIRLHGGEGQFARDRFGKLSSRQRDALLRFLRTL